MVQLLCEGRCNPQISELTSLADSYVTPTAGYGQFAANQVVCAIPAHILNALRALQHTEHRYVRSHLTPAGRADLYACIDCGTERRWGLSN